MAIKVIFQGPNFFVVEFGQKQYYFSYKTCMAFADLKAQVFIRRESDYSKTTTDHLWEMGVYNWRKVRNSDFDMYLE